MGRECVDKCDSCGREKGEGNKWLLVDIFISSNIDQLAADSFFTILHWTDEAASDEAQLGRGIRKFICGEDCLNKLQKTFLDLRSRMVAPEEGHPAHVPEPDNKKHSYSYDHV